MLKCLPVSVKTRALWELSARPAYLLGVVAAAEQAIRQNVPQISVIEFGVAGGDGLLLLETEAAAIEREMGIGIRVYGFDRGREGLPTLIGDYRDHPEVWRPGDFPMDEESLRMRLSKRTSLILGNVRETVAEFFIKHQPPPVGFVSFDLDLYSSTRDALKLFLLEEKRMLWHVPLYFDDIDFLFNHRFAGELLAIDEFNKSNDKVRIDRWYGLKTDRPFPERSFLEKFYVAHDCEAISKIHLSRDVRKLPLQTN